MRQSRGYYTVTHIRREKKQFKDEIKTVIILSRVLSYCRSNEKTIRHFYWVTLGLPQISLQVGLVSIPHPNHCRCPQQAWGPDFPASALEHCGKKKNTVCHVSFNKHLSFFIKLEICEDRHTKSQDGAAEWTQAWVKISLQCHTCDPGRSTKPTLLSSSVPSEQSGHKSVSEWFRWSSGRKCLLVSLSADASWWCSVSTGKTSRCLLFISVGMTWEASFYLQKNSFKNRSIFSHLH